VILMRKDPPFDTEYIYSTYILDRAQLQGALVCNRPQGLRDMNEKVYTAWFPECCAPTLITRDMHDMGEFLREHGKAVCKPLDGMGGKSIFVLEQGDKNRNVVFETLTGYGTRYAIVQRYLPEIVTAGDCRIILVDGEPVPFALQRIPNPEDHRGNLAAGAREGATINDVLVAATAGALRRYLLSRGQDVNDLEIRVAVPVNQRPLDRGAELGNQFGLVFLPLPIGVADGRRRLLEAKRRMDELKASLQPAVAMGVLSLLGYAPSRVQPLAVEFFGSKASAVLTNVPGPREQLYLAGKALKSTMFWVPQSGRLGLGISILSYHGQVLVGVASDAGLVPDPERIVSEFEAELAELTRPAGRGRRRKA